MRFLTISSLLQKRLTRNINVPFIRLTGLYLQEAGFNIGTKIKVEISKDEIIISKM